MPRHIRIQSGGFVEDYVVPQLHRNDSPRQRREKRKASTEIRQRINDKKSALSMHRRLACNFDVGDILIHLTYIDEMLPKDFRAAEKMLSNYKRRMRNEFKKHGAEFKYISVTEGANGLHRFHHHMVIKNTFTGALELALSFWTYGGSKGKHIERNADGTPGYGDIAAYLTKENREDGGIRPVGKRSWTASKGLLRETITREYVPNSYQVQIPPRVIVVDPVTVLRSDWGSRQSCSYYIPPKQPKKRKKAAGEAPVLPLEEGYNIHASGWVEYCPPGIVRP